MNYQRRKLTTATDVGPPGPLPPELLDYHLDNADLENVAAVIGQPAARDLGLLDTGFFPAADPPAEAEADQPEPT